MNIKIFNETGLNEALLGLSLSFYDHIIPLEEFWTPEKQVKALKRARILAHLPGNSGEGKFLESIMVWVFIQGTRDWWQEFDTYRVGVTKNSSSTMHKLDKRQLLAEDCSPFVDQRLIEIFNEQLVAYRTPNSPIYKNIGALKANLPEGFLQERMVCLNYKTIQNMYNQRASHRHYEWREFITYMLKNLKNPEFIEKSLGV